MSRSLVRAAWVSATLAPIALIGGWTVAAGVQTVPYDSTRDTISALAQIGQPDRWIMTTGIAVLGVCHLVTALGFREARAAGRVVLAVGGVLTIGVAVFALPSGAHGPVAMVTFVALAVWPAFSGVPGRGTSITATAVMLVLLVVFGLGLDGGLVGLSERVLAGAESLWPLVALVVTRGSQASKDAMSITKR